MCFLLFMLIDDNRLANGYFFLDLLPILFLKYCYLSLITPPIVPNRLDFEVLVILKVRLCLSLGRSPLNNQLINRFHYTIITIICILYLENIRRYLIHNCAIVYL